MKKKKLLERLLNNFKDPKFVIQIWQNITVLGFVVGILLGATFTQNFYVEQVNTIFSQAAEEDGCFNNYLNNYLQTNELGFMKNLSSLGVYNVSDEAPNPD